jgi:CheY-like chemotaxis protein
MSALAAPTASTNHAPRKATILCVDDSEEILLISRTILEAGGLDVLTATNGLAALETLCRHPIDAVVIDNRMPGMTGVELAGKIRSGYKNLPILMFSDSGPEPAHGNTINLFLNKKGGPRAMRDAVRNLLQRSSPEAGQGEVE